MTDDFVLEFDINKDSQFEINIYDIKDDESQVRTHSLVLTEQELDDLFFYIIKYKKYLKQQKANDNDSI